MQWHQTIEKAMFICKKIKYFFRWQSWKIAARWDSTVSHYGNQMKDTQFFEVNFSLPQENVVDCDDDKLITRVWVFGLKNLAITSTTTRVAGYEDNLQKMQLFSHIL